MYSSSSIYGFYQKNLRCDCMIGLPDCVLRMPQPRCTHEISCVNRLHTAHYMTTS